MSPYDAAAWSDFAVATAGAAAALAGLLFVAVSINLQAILATPLVPGRAAQALILLATPIFLSLTVLVPGQPTGALGAELIVLGALVGTVLAWLNRPAHHSAEQPWSAWVLGNVAPTAVLSVGTLLAGAGVLTSSLGGLYWLPAAIGFALLGGLANAWGLLIEILR